MMVRIENAQCFRIINYNFIRSQRINVAKMCKIALEGNNDMTNKAKWIEMAMAILNMFHSFMWLYTLQSNSVQYFLNKYRDWSRKANASRLSVNECKSVRKTNYPKNIYFPLFFSWVQCLCRAYVAYWPFI